MGWRWTWTVQAKSEVVAPFGVTSRIHRTPAATGMRWKRYSSADTPAPRWPFAQIWYAASESPKIQASRSNSSQGMSSVTRGVWQIGIDLLR